MRAYELTEETRMKLNSEEFHHLQTPGLLKLGELYKKNGFDLRIVGGAVRDLVLGKEPKDIDLASDATPEESLKMLQQAGYKTIETGLQHGTITAIVNGEDFEITTLRIDTEHTGRHATVEYTKSWEKDAERRDLTFNAMSLSLDGTLHDYFGGIQDLKAGKAKFVGSPDQRIQEDYLRILRYFRFQGRTNKPNWDKETLDAIERNAKGLEQISGERIWMEFAKILAGKHTKEILDKMRSTGVDLYIHLPPLNEEVLDRIKKNTDNPATILGGMLQKEAQVDKLAAKWKFSADERDLMRFIVAHKHGKFDLDIAKQMWTNTKTKKDYILELAKFFGRQDIVNTLKTWKTPVFPVSGNDLKDLGVKPGPEMGKILGVMTQHWKETGYELDKDELLKWAELK